MEARELKGLHIAAAGSIQQKGDTWLVPSAHGSKIYTVRFTPQIQSCTCLDYETTRQKCKHVYAVAQMLARQPVLEPLPPVQRPTYKQEWREYNLAQVNEKSKLLSLLFELCQNTQEPVQTMGRPRASMADIIFAACLKVYGGMSGRRNQSDLREAIQRGYILSLIHI